MDKQQSYRPSAQPDLAFPPLPFSAAPVLDCLLRLRACLEKRRLSRMVPTVACVHTKPRKTCTRFSLLVSTPLCCMTPALQTMHMRALCVLACVADCVVHYSWDPP